MNKVFVGCLGCFTVATIYAAIGFASAWVIEWTWNLLVPTLFHGPRIDFWMACALYIALSLIGGLFRGSQGQS